MGNGQYAFSYTWNLNYVVFSVLFTLAIHLQLYWPDQHDFSIQNVTAPFRATKTQLAVCPTKLLSYTVCPLSCWPTLLPTISCSFLLWAYFLGILSCFVFIAWGLLTLGLWLFAAAYRCLGCLGDAASLPILFSFLYFSLYSRFGAFWMLENARKVVSK